MVASVEVSARIEATPSRVWRLVGDPVRMGEWSPECRAVRWRRPARGPAVGARFTGHNRIGRRRWSTTGTVVVHDPDRELAFDVHLGPLAVARWTYRLEPAGAACVVTETFEDRRGAVVRFAGRVVRGVSDVPEHNRRGMVATLDAVRTAAETVSP